jgi:membrane protease YdiL (CAAX protease family)
VSLLHDDPDLLAQRQGRWRLGWAIVATSLAVVLVFTGLFAVVGAIQSFADVTGGIPALNEAMNGGASALLGNPYSLAPFLMLGLVLPAAVWVAAHVQGRRFRDFCQPAGDFRWQNFWRMTGAYLAGLLIGLPLSLGTMADGVTFRFDLFSDPLFLAAAIAVIAIQTFGEEVAFRGYLLHAWGAIWPKRILVSLIFAGIFTWLHVGNDDLMRDPVPMLIAFFAGEVFAYWLVARTGSLDACWGQHFINNVVVMLLLSVQPGPTNTAAIIQYTDTTWAAGGSYAFSPLFYLSLVLGLGLSFLFAVHPRSPFYIAPAKPISGS